uniref:Uncharacterized protein n=1 Tax=Parascaris equorum TaxID=6256 RepID=A0A914RXX8_PAREQ
MFIRLIKKNEFKSYKQSITHAVSVLGTIGGAAAIYSAIEELATTKFAMPCYVQPFVTITSEVALEKSTNCCGRWQNISRYDDISVCSPYTDFYNQYS